MASAQWHIDCVHTVIFQVNSNNNNNPYDDEYAI